MSASLLDEPGTEAEAKQATWTLNFGPQHPATHTTLRLILELDGERIIKATPDIGYLHSGFEKLGEHLNFNQYVTVADRKNYISPPLNEVAWHGAVEKLLDIDLTPRCKYIRVIISELARIAKFQASFQSVYVDVEKLLFRNRIFLDRLRGVGRLSKRDAIALSCTG